MGIPTQARGKERATIKFFILSSTLTRNMTDERKLFYFRSHGVLITIHNVLLRPDMITSILHEFVPGRHFGCAVQEECQDGGLHLHIVVFCTQKFTWVRSNLLEQLKVPSLHMEMVLTYEDSIIVSAYMAKFNVPVVWGVNAQTNGMIKRQIHRECIAYRRRQNWFPGLNQATEQLRRIERAWVQELNDGDSGCSLADLDPE